MPESGVTWSLKERRRQCTPVVGPPSAASPARTHRLARSVQHGDAPRWDRSGQSDRCPRRPLRSAQRGQLHRWVPPVPSHQLHPCFPPVPLRRSRQWLPPPPCARLPQSRRLPRLTRRSRRSRRTRVSGCACRTSHAGCPSLTQVLAASAQLSVDASPTRSWRGHTSWRGTCPPSVCSEDALNSLWGSVRIEQNTRHGGEIVAY